MAGAKGELKHFYRQRKRAKFSSSRPKKTGIILGDDSPQPSVLISHDSLDLKDDCDEPEEILKQFDLNMVYGPCLGISRLERWERANKMGLHPPPNVRSLLMRSDMRMESLWEGRV